MVEEILIYYQQALKSIDKKELPICIAELMRLFADIHLQLMY